MYTTDPAYPDLVQFKSIVKPLLAKRCGVRPEVEVSFPVAGYAIDSGGDQTYATLNVAKMVQARVTTVLWFGGVEGKTTQAADEQKFYPEIVYAGDSLMESWAVGLVQAQAVWSHAWILTNLLREDDFTSTPGYQAFREGDPQAPDDPDASYAVPLYRDFFLLATGIQAAGPRLHPTTVEDGFRQIPALRSTSPYVPACFFRPGGYTCVQDTAEWWWDPTGVMPGTTTNRGCYRMVDGGQRYVLGTWTTGDRVFTNSVDPCSGYNVGYFYQIRPPDYGSD